MQREPWTQERLAKARELWSKGVTAEAIAKALGGTTKNAVISKLHREGDHAKRKKRLVTKKNKVPAQAYKGLEQRIQQLRQLAATMAQPSPSSSPMVELSSSERAATPGPQLLDLHGLKPHHCRWPIGDPRDEDFHFCGEPRLGRRSYCLDHCRQAYQGKRFPETGKPFVIKRKAA